MCLGGLAFSRRLVIRSMWAAVVDAACEILVFDFQILILPAVRVYLLCRLNSAYFLYNAGFIAWDEVHSLVSVA